jgi:hypothetical protein
VSELPSIIEYSQDLASAEAPKPLPAREYRATIREAKIAVSKSSGKPNLNVSFTIPSDQYPADYTDGNPDGTTLTIYLSTEDNAQARYRMKRFIEAVGAPLGKSVDPATLIGLEAMVSIEHEPYEGVMQARIKSYRAI